MFRFADPYMFNLLVIIPILIVIFVIAVRARNRRIAKFGNPDTIAPLMPEVSMPRVRYKFALTLVAITLIIVALARPQLGAKLKESTRTGIEIMLTVDVSNSMLAEDLEPNRIERTKYAINRLIESLKDDQIGLVIFAGDAYVQLPITSDYTAARNFVEQVSPDMVSKQGTDIGRAIDLSASLFSSDSEGSRVMILISDGENHENDALTAAKKAAEAGIKIYTIGIGTPEGSPIMINGEHIKDEKGDMVVSKLNEEMMQQIAIETGGAYIRASNRSVGLEEIVEQINKTEKRKLKQQLFEEFNEQYQYILGFVLLLLVVETLMIPRKNRILARFNIFNRKRS